MLRSGKELKIFSVNDKDLTKFCTAAKKYGVLYTILKDRNASDGKTEIMVRAEDSAKVAHIYERFNIATVDIASVEKTIEKSLNKDSGTKPVPEKVGKEKSKEEMLVDEILKKPNPTKEEVQNVNPSTARAEKNKSQSEPYSSKSKPQQQTNSSPSEEGKPSVRKELNEIRKEQEKRRENKPFKTKENVHKAPLKNKKKKEKSR